MALVVQAGVLDGTRRNTIKFELTEMTYSLEQLRLTNDDAPVMVNEWTNRLLINTALGTPRRNVRACRVGEGIARPDSTGNGGGRESRVDAMPALAVCRERQTTECRYD